jgi:hypothetical protein
MEAQTKMAQPALNKTCAYLRSVVAQSCSVSLHRSGEQFPAKENATKNRRYLDPTPAY